MRMAHLGHRCLQQIRQDRMVASAIWRFPRLGGVRACGDSLRIQKMTANRLEWVLLSHVEIAKLLSSW